MPGVGAGNLRGATVNVTLTEMKPALAIAVAALAGCVSSASPSEPAAFDEDDPTAAQPTAAAEPEAPAPPARSTEIPEDVAGTIPGAALDAVLDRGPGYFLAGIEVEPAFRSGKFAGWVIMRFEPEDTRVGDAPLMAGDIVVAVNQHPIAKPQQLQSVWDELRTADHLVIAGERGGTTFELRYDIGR